MRTLVVGAGAIGGYFGGRLLEARRDVTFLVRPRRAALLAQHGLVIRSPTGDAIMAAPPTVTADAIPGPYDLILLACKSYDLDDAMTSLAPGVGPQTAILPLLNGMRHIDVLHTRFGPTHVVGGLCHISSGVDAEGRILHFNDMHRVTFGELDGSSSARAEAIAALMSGSHFESRLSQAIRQEMWEKWVFIATGAGATCLMRAAVGDIVAAGAADLVGTLLDECARIACAQGFPPDPKLLEQTRALFTKPGSPIKASMLRDIERGGPIEADHIFGELLRLDPSGGTASPLLRIVYAHLKAYEAQRAREAAS
jgi:2-dehydropantoate 2-reductase